MANSENDILRDAIIGTEKEIFGDAFAKDDLTLDETGDRSLEAMGEGLEGQREPDEDEAEDEASEEETLAKPADTKAETKVETKVETDAKAEDRQDDRGRVPPGRLREEAERARAAIAERDAIQARYDAERQQSATRLAQLEAQNAAILAALQRGQAPAPKAEETKPETAPDLFENPNAFAEHLRREAMQPIEAVRKEMADMRINMSMETARARHGETFDAAFTAIRRLDPNNPENKALVQRLIAQPNPGDAMVQWHKRNEVLREVGEDPASYKARIAEETRKALASDPEFRKQLLAEMRGDAETGDGGRPRAVTRLPGSLARAAGGNSRAPNDNEQFDDSDNSVFASAFK